MFLIFVNSNFGFFHDVIDFVQNVLILVYGGLPFLWGYTLSLIERFGFTADDEVIFMFSVIYL